MRIHNVFIALALLTACSKSPIDRAEDASGGGGLGKFGVTPNFVIFSDELKSGGGAFEFPGGENQTLTFADQSNPISHRSIRYSWSGGDVSAPGCFPNPQHVFAGFDLMHTPTLDGYSVTPGRDLRAAGYTKLTFFARGGLSTANVLKVEVASSGNPAGCQVPIPSPCVTLSTNGTDDDPNFPCGTTATLSSSWQSYTIVVPNASLASVKDYFKATFIFNSPPGNLAAGQGGTVYFDQIQYQP